MIDTTITLRIFPQNRRASFSSKVITIHSEYPTLKDVIQQCSELNFENFSFAKGITFMKLDEPVLNNDTINVFYK